MLGLVVDHHDAAQHLPAIELKTFSEGRSAPPFLQVHRGGDSSRVLQQVSSRAGNRTQSPEPPVLAPLMTCSAVGPRGPSLTVLGAVQIYHKQDYSQQVGMTDRQTWGTEGKKDPETYHLREEN